MGQKHMIMSNAQLLKLGKSVPGDMGQSTSQPLDRACAAAAHPSSGGSSLTDLQWCDSKLMLVADEFTRVAACFGPQPPCWPDVTMDGLAPGTVLADWACLCVGTLS